MRTCRQDESNSDNYLSSLVIFNLTFVVLSMIRQMAARYVQEALRTSRTKEEIHHILRLMVRLSDDIGK